MQDSSGARHSISVVWDYFTKIERDTKKISKCKLCYLELSGHLAGNAKKHLDTRHGFDVAGPVSSLDDDRQETGRRKLRDELAHLQHTKNFLAKRLTDLTGQCYDTAETFSAYVRATRSDSFDKDRHRAQNKEATRRWRARRAQRDQLRKEVNNLETLVASAVRGHRGNTAAACDGALSSSWPTQTARYVTTYFMVKPFDRRQDRAWYMHAYVENDMQMYRFANRRAALNHLSSQFRLATCHRGYSAYPEWLRTPEDAVVQPNDAVVRAYIEHYCWEDVRSMDDGTFDDSGQIGWVIEYAATRLGALFLQCHEERRAIAFANEFLPRDIFCSAHLIRIFAEQLRAGEYYWRFDRLEIVVATHFLHIFQPILMAAGAHIEEGLAALLGHDPDTHTIEGRRGSFVQCNLLDADVTSMKEVMVLMHVNVDATRYAEEWRYLICSGDYTYCKVRVHLRQIASLDAFEAQLDFTSGLMGDIEQEERRLLDPPSL